MTDAPAWALGHDVSMLKKRAAIFAAAHKPHVYGAFGLTKERDIATALDSGGFFCDITVDGSAAALGHKLTRDSVHDDFSGRGLRLSAGSFYVKAFAADNVPAATRLMSQLRAKLRCRLYVEIFEEDGVAKSSLLKHNFEYIGTKVSAGGEVKGLYRDGRAFMQAAGLSEADELTLHKIKRKFLDANELVGIRKELSHYEGEFEQHYSSYNKRKSWSAFALRGFKASEPGFIIKPAEMSKAWKEEHPGSERWVCTETRLAQRFPTVWDAIHRIPRDHFERVRFMRLAEKKGELSRHADITDRYAGLAPNKVARLHIPIYTSPLVKFRAWDHRGDFLEEKMTEGSIWYLDTRKPHSVVNEGDIVRVHLVVDVVCNKDTVEWVCSRMS